MRTITILAGLSLCAPMQAQNKKELQVAFHYSLDSMAQIQTRLANEIRLCHERLAEQRGVIGDHEREAETLNGQLNRSRSRLDSTQQVLQAVRAGVRTYLPPINYTDHRGYLHERKVLAYFSDPALPDTFKLLAQGPDLLGAVITFSVVDWRGRTLHQCDIEPLGPDEITASEELQACTIQRKVLYFFNELAFRNPAISPELERWYDRNGNGYQGIEYASWDAIRRDPRSLSFTFLAGEQKIHTIAFDRTSGKVVDIQR